MDLFVPLGFMDAKEMLVPLSRIILKWAISEHFAVFSNPARDSVLKHLVLIDNAAYSYSLQLDNGIPIIPFYASKKDTELHELAAFLLTLVDVEDVRPVLREKFKNHLISENSKNMNVLFKKLFGI